MFVKMPDAKKITGGSLLTPFLKPTKDNQDFRNYQLEASTYGSEKIRKKKSSLSSTKKNVQMNLPFFP